MEFEGYYRVVSSGSVIGEFHNMITANGLTAINQYMANIIPTWAGSIGIGATAASPTTSNHTQLEYELQRYPITLRTYRTASGVHQQAVKASIAPDAVFQAYELGLFPMTVDPSSHTDNYQVTDFSEQDTGVSRWTYLLTGLPATLTVASPTPRMGSFNLTLPAGSVVYGNLAISTLGFNEYDSVKLLAYVSSSITSTSSITLTFADDSANIYTWTASTTIPSTGSGQYLNLTLNFNPKDSLFSDSVVSGSISFVGTGQLKLDQIKLIQNDSKPVENMLVSRTSSASTNVPLFEKTYGQPMEIEYYVRVT